MLTRAYYLALPPFLLLASCSGPSSKQDKMPRTTPPLAAEKPHTITAPHGASRTDEYYWLRERENPEVVKYLKAENSYLDTVLSPVKTLREDLFKEMKARIKEDDQGVPFKKGAYYYSYRYKKGQEYPIHFRMAGFPSNKEQVIFDENVMAKGHDYFDLGGYEVSDDGKLAAYTIDTVSRRLYTLYIRNLETGEDYGGIPNVEGGAVAWSADGQYVFYVLKNPETLLGYAIMRHKLRTDPKEDVKVYEEKDNQFYIGVGRTKSRKYIEISTAQNGVSTEEFLLDAANPTGKFQSILKRRKGHEYFITHAGDRFLIKTNAGGATNFKLMEIPDQLPAAKESEWKEVIPHRADVLLEGVDPFAKYLAIMERKGGLLQIRVRDRQSGEDHYLPFRDPAYLAAPTNNEEMDSGVLRYTYTSMTTPFSQYDYDMATRKSTLLKEQPVLGDFDKNNYASERITAKAEDGTEVPISIVYKKGFKKDGSQPLLQYAYGSYGHSIDPTFSSVRLSLLDRGFAFAICHIRGGEDMGRSWYENGKLLNKKNTFTDFIACGKHLLDQKYTSSDKLFCMGGSAGGLLMGAVANMAPEGMYKGMVAQVPFVDVVTTMLDSTIPLTTNEYEEWGNPNEKKWYDYMLSYSPYDNVTEKSYPNLLVTTGLHDSQVQYWEPAKWVARLRKKHKGDNLILLHTQMEAGHGGASGRFEALKEYALEYAFLLSLAGGK